MNIVLVHYAVLQTMTWLNIQKRRFTKITKRTESDYPTGKPTGVVQELLYYNTCTCILCTRGVNKYIKGPNVQAAKNVAALETLKQLIPGFEPDDKNMLTGRAEEDIAYFDHVKVG